MNDQVKMKKILIVDDSDDDVETTIRALKKTDIPGISHHRCEDGEEALDYLQQFTVSDTSTSADKPDIILLDLNMPGKDGRKVLEEIRNNPVLKLIPVIIMTTSGDPEDVSACYDLGACSFIRKPVDLDNFYSSIQSLVHYWFETVILPGGSAHD